MKETKQNTTNLKSVREPRAEESNTVIMNSYLYSIWPIKKKCTLYAFISDCSMLDTRIYVEHDNSVCLNCQWVDSAPIEFNFNLGFYCFNIFMCGFCWCARICWNTQNPNSTATERFRYLIYISRSHWIRCWKIGEFLFCRWREKKTWFFFVVENHTHFTNNNRMNHANNVHKWGLTNGFLGFSSFETQN